jgi:hypothetical protein
MAPAPARLRGVQRRATWRNHTQGRGVDLWNNCIGVEEWADMVHFVRHVGRRLEIVVAKDKAFLALCADAADEGRDNVNNGGRQRGRQRGQRIAK